MFPVETPASRATDPHTSHLAEQHINASGERAKQQAIAEAAVLQYPGHTSMELSKLTGIDRYNLARRLPECETAKAVKRGPARTCSVTGRQAVTWFGPHDEVQLEMKL